MATGAADGLFWSVYEGCLSGWDTTIKRRPYHRNCTCALHEKSRRNCPHAFPNCYTVSYPKRKAWSEGCLAMATSSRLPSILRQPTQRQMLGTGLWDHAKKKSKIISQRGKPAVK